MDLKRWIGGAEKLNKSKTKVKQIVMKWKEKKWNWSELWKEKWNEEKGVKRKNKLKKKWNGSGTDRKRWNERK